MMRPIPQRTIIKWKIANLKPHPKQGSIFSDPPQHEVDELAADIKKNGQLQALEILPDGTIIAGHKRVAAARKLGWTEINVWVRHELVGDDVAVEKRLVEDNLNRRQLGPLEIARCYKHLKELEMKGGIQRMYPERNELRDRIGRRLDVSGRTLDRYLRVLEHTPQEVQDAVTTGQLPVTVAEKVAGLSKRQREQIAEEIRAGGNAIRVVRRLLTAAPKRVRNATDVKDVLVRALERVSADLAGRVDQVRSITSRDQNSLRSGATIIRRLLTRADALRRDATPQEEPSTDPGEINSSSAGKEFDNGQGGH